MRFLSFKFWPVVQIDHKSSHLSTSCSGKHKYGGQREKQQEKTGESANVVCWKSVDCQYIVGRLWESEGLGKTTWSDTSSVGFGKARNLVRKTRTWNYAWNCDKYHFI